MPNAFTLYCAILIIFMVFFNYQGIAYTGLIYGNQNQAQKSANRFHK